MISDTDWMSLALEQAQLAADLDEVPVGAVVVCQGRPISMAHNLRQNDGDPVAHAEILAIQAAARHLGDWRLIDTVLYVTLEPCPMCAGAILLARIPRLVYAAADPKSGAVESLYNLLSDHRLNHQTEVTAGILREESRDLLQSFFRKKRRR
jgi:tRNA(adenine34) deaminase